MPRYVSSSRHPESARSPEAMYWTERSREAAKFESAAKENQIFEGNLASLKRFKDDVKEVRPAMSAVLYLKDSTIFRSSIRSRPISW